MQFEMTNCILRVRPGDLSRYRYKKTVRGSTSGNAITAHHRRDAHFDLGQHKNRHRTWYFIGKQATGKERERLHGRDDAMASENRVGNKEPRRLPAIPVDSEDDVALTIDDAPIPSGEFCPTDSEDDDPYGGAYGTQTPLEQQPTDTAEPTEGSVVTGDGNAVASRSGNASRRRTGPVRGAHTKRRFTETEALCLAKACVTQSRQAIQREDNFWNGVAKTVQTVYGYKGRSPNSLRNKWQRLAKDC